MPHSLHKALKNILKALVFLTLALCFLYPFIYPPQSILDVATNKTESDLLNSSLNAELTSVSVGTSGLFNVVYTSEKIQLSPVFSAEDKAPDFTAILDIPNRKQAFFDFIGDMSQQINQVILIQRRFLLDIQHKGTLSNAETEALDYLTQVYRVRDLPHDEKLEQLLGKVNIIPTPMVKVQTANESGWGTSRFATQGFNYFGLWCYQEGCGFVPNQRPDGMTHEVARFKSLAEGMYLYKINLNRNNAYREMREIRAQLGSDSQYELSHAMIDGLLAYSERGEAYIEELHDMLVFNRKFL